MNKHIFIIFMVAALAGCAKGKEKVTIFTSAEEFRITYIQAELDEHFPDYNIDIQYIPSGNMMARIVAEGNETECDIAHDIDYGYAERAWNLFADVSYDRAKYAPDTIFMDGSRIVPECRSGASVIISRALLRERNLPVPQRYEDLLAPEFKGLVSMPNPKSSGTSYSFLKSLVNAWGEDRAFEYFDALSENILQFTTSGSGPVNALVQGEAAVALGPIAQAVQEINNGVDLEILFFEEGAPFSLWGMGVIKGKETRAPVMEVFHYIEEVVNPKDNALFYPEKIYADVDFALENYPQNIHYADMSGNTQAEKERLLEKWRH